jgi:hypothetical protein
MLGLAIRMIRIEIDVWLLFGQTRLTLLYYEHPTLSATHE